MKPRLGVLCIAAAAAAASLPPSYRIRSQFIMCLTVINARDTETEWNRHHLLHHVRSINAMCNDPFIERLGLLQNFNTETLGGQRQSLGKNGCETSVTPVSIP
jgi:hypothetical protein